jgi:hypothetical protein
MKCDLCDKAWRLESAAIRESLEKHQDEYPDSDWDYWDECCYQETLICGDCPNFLSKSLWDHLREKKEEVA